MIITKWNSMSGRVPVTVCSEPVCAWNWSALNTFWSSKTVSPSPIGLNHTMFQIKWNMSRYMVHFKLCPVSVTSAWIGLKTGSIKVWCSARANAGRSIGDCSSPLWQIADPLSVSKVAHTSLSDGYQCESATHVYQPSHTVNINFGYEVRPHQ